MSKEKPAKKISVYGYIRKSTEDNQEGKTRRQQNSLNYQRNTLKEIAERNNLRIVKIFEDSKTGYKAFIREEFNQMLETFSEQGKEGTIKGVVCSEHNRLARNFGDGGLVLWYLQDGLIDKIYTFDKIFTNSASDQMMLAINFAMAKHSSDETSFRARRTWDLKASEGQPPNQHIPGYKYVGDKGKKVWKPDPKNAPIIIEMFKRFSTGKYTVTEIYDFVNGQGLTSARTGNTYKSEKSVRDLLKKKEYAGFFTYEGEERVGSYKPLIAPDLYYKVQEVLEGTSHPKAVGKSEYAYTGGLIKCKVCGGNMSGTIRKGITYYRCLNRAEPCKSNKDLRPSYLKQSLIDEKITELFKEIEISEKKFKELSSYISDVFEDEKSKYRTELVTLKGKLSNAEGEFDEYTKLLAQLKKVEKERRGEDWKFDEEGYTRLREDAHQKIESCKRQIRKVEELKEEIPSMMINFLDNIRIVASRFKDASPSNKRQIVDTLCANFEWDGEKLSWDWKKPYHILTDSKEKGNWLRDQDSNLEPND